MQYQILNFFLTKLAKYDCLDEISIDINIPDKKVRKILLPALLQRKTNKKTKQIDIKTSL